ncbi:hypothetical protein BGX26_008616 [Mortierella sp. AD094]|nr:hypothetical protein BGX26_008616 [Mortierella sp. AD094]
MGTWDVYHCNVKGVQGGPGFPDPTEEFSEPIEWLEQHHKKTLNKSQTHINPTQNYLNLPTHHNSANDASYASHLNNIKLVVPPFHEYPLSGDESDNNHNQMEHLRSQFYTPDPQKRTKEYHIEQAIQAIELLKIATRPNGWKKIDKHKSGCLVYQSMSSATIPTHSDVKYPAYKGEHIIRGYKAQDVFSIVSVRKLWDDWYDELSCVETYDEATTLMYMVMKGTLSSKTRDIALVERVEHDKNGTIYYASCSVESSKIPRASGKVRAEVSLTGWVIEPLPSNPPITKITYVIQTDILSRLPKFIAKRSMAKRALVIATVESYLRKNGTPAMAATSTRTLNRQRSLSEPLKLDRFLLPEESDGDDDDDEPSGAAFLSPMGPIKSRQDLHYMDDSAESEEELEMEMSRALRQQATAKTASPVKRGSISATNTLFSKEFMENNEFLQDSNLFGDSSFLFGNGSSYFEDTQKKQEVAPAAPAASSMTRLLPSAVKQQVQQEQAQERPKEKKEKAGRPRRPSNTSKTLLSESDSRKAPSNKRVSIPVVAPKSEARVKQSTGSQSGSNSHLPVPGSTPAGAAATSSPPPTPPASINGKDATSDSDAATQSVKVVPRSPKTMPTSTSTSTESTSLAMSSLAMKSPSALMEANNRRHSALISRNAGFVPRHSHGIPIRGNPNVSLQSLIRPSGPSSSMSTSMKRHSTTLSVDSSRSSTIFTPLMVLPHRHSETARKALAMFKVLASSPEDRWRAISSENGFKSYSRVISGAGLPMLRGEGTITGGWTVEQINAVIESSGCRQVWDERFENMSIAETFNHNEYLFHVSLLGVGSMTGRDLAGVTIIDRDPQTSSLFNVSTSVLDPTIPEDPGRIRAMLELSGWSLRPTFDGQGNTLSVNVTFVIQIDIRGNLPSSVVKSMTSSMSTAVSRLNQFINKSGYPPFASHISGTRLMDTFEPKTGFYELCYKAAPGWTEVRIGRKVYKEGYDFFIKPDDPSVKVEMAPDFGGVRVWTTLDHEGQSIIAQVSRKGQNVIVAEPEVMEEQKNEAEVEVEAAVKGGLKDGSARHSEIEEDMRYLSPTTRNRRSASFATPAAQNTLFSTRPESQASIASKASQSSERGRTRGRSSRPLVTLPAGTPPPPLPRRSSSLTRLSIPISEYLPGADAPPVPVNPTIANASESSLALTSRPISESLGSPTLGFFHVPVVPVVAGGAAVSSAAISSTSSTSPTSPASITSPTSPMESITAVLSEEVPATTVADAEPESALTIAAAAVAVAAVAPKAETVSVTTEAQSIDVPLTPVMAMDKKPIDRKIDEVVSSLSSQVSPTSTPVPSPMAMTFSPRGSSLPSASVSEPVTPSPMKVEIAAPSQPAASQKINPPSAMLSGATKKRVARVTFSLDTIDKSSSDDTVRGGLMKINNSKGHAVQIVTPAQHQQQRAVVEQGSDCESDEAEFVEARDELSEDELEFAFVLMSVGAWPTMLSASSSSYSPSAVELEEKHKGEEMVAASLKAVETGFRMVTTGSPTEVKIAIVFLLLVYYAGRLSSLIA